MQNLRARRSCIAVVSTLLAVLLYFVPGTARAQTLSGTVQGTVVDPSDAAVPGATVQIENPVSGYMLQAKTDTVGNFACANIPFTPYHLTVSSQGFASFAEDVDVRSSVPITLM